MKNAHRFAVVAAAILFTAVVMSPVVAGPTVGDLLHEIAKFNNLPATSGVQAAAELRAMGVNLPALELGKDLTQGDVVRIARALGVNVSSSNPGASFSGKQVNQFIDSFGGQLVFGSNTSARPNQNDSHFSENGADPRTKGKGKKKGLFKSPSEPE